MRVEHRARLLAMVTVGVLAHHVKAPAAAQLRSQDFATSAVFDLIVEKSRMLKPGSTKIVTESAFVRLGHAFGNPSAERLEIRFFTRPIDPSEVPEMIATGQAKRSPNEESAALVLHLDKAHHVTQADLSILTQGTTVARTMASMPADLKKYFSDYQFDGKQLRLKTTGSRSEPEIQNEKMYLAWMVDLNLPVFQPAR